MYFVFSKLYWPIYFISIGEIPVYIKKQIIYDEQIIGSDYSASTNIDENGISNGFYNNNINQNDVVTVIGADSLHVSLTYALENNYDFVCPYEGVYTGIINPKNSNDGYINKYTSSTKTTVEFDVPGDTVTFHMYTDGSNSSFYGYYAVVTGKKYIETPISILHLYTEADYVSLNPNSSDMFKDTKIDKIDFLSDEKIVSENIIDLNSMFENCTARELDLTKLNLADSVTITDIFKECDNLEKLFMCETGSDTEIVLPGEYIIDDDEDELSDDDSIYSSIPENFASHKYIVYEGRYTLSVPDEITWNDPFFDIEFECNESYIGSVTFTITSPELDFTDRGYVVELYADYDRTVPFESVVFTSEGSTRVYLKKVLISEERAGNTTRYITFNIAS